MHPENSSAPEHYRVYVGRKVAMILGGVVLAVIMFFVLVSVGGTHPDSGHHHNTSEWSGDQLVRMRIIWNTRIPQVQTVVVAGAGLAIAGVAMQSILRNPLISPFTLGLSNAAAFGACHRDSDVRHRNDRQQHFVCGCSEQSFPHDHLCVWFQHAHDRNYSADCKDAVDDAHLFLIPGSFVCGVVLLLISDIVARTLIAPHVLPIAVLTAFIGAPVFLYLIIRGRRM